MTEIQTSQTNSKKPLRLKLKKIPVPMASKPSISISLYDYQIPHKERLDAILDKNAFALDFSVMGSGKTYTSAYIYLENRFQRFKRMLVITTVTGKNKWIEVIAKYNVPKTRVLSYSEIRSTKFKQPTHGLLTRNDFIEYRRNKRVFFPRVMIQDEKVTFYCTPEYLQMVNDGLLLIIDEIQNLKNNSNQSEACTSLVLPIVEQYKKDPVNAKSRFILLSSTPIDETTQSVRIFRLLGILTEEKLIQYIPSNNSAQLVGLRQILDFCYSHINETEVCEVYARYHPYVGKVSPRIELPQYYQFSCYQIFDQLIKKYFGHSMESIPNQSKINIVKAFYRLYNPSDLELLKQGIRLLIQNSGYDIATRQIVKIPYDGNNFSLPEINQALMMIETAKIGLLTRIAKTKLEQNPNLKVVICVNYSQTIDDLMNLLSVYNPLRLDSRVSKLQRSIAITHFQDKTNQYRLLIGNIRICNSGIDLDDQDGRFPRFCLVNPNYSPIELEQMCHRFNRCGTKSDTTIHFVFETNNSEDNILRELSYQSGTTLSDKIALDGYACWYESDEITPESKSADTWVPST
ncbi:MAG: hypothetical protein ABIN35_00260 [candidate division WOR-3 bacterium]